MTSETKGKVYFQWACPACGSDFIRGIDPGDTYDGEQGSCGSCPQELEMGCFTGKDGSESWLLVAVRDTDEEPSDGT